MCMFTMTFLHFALYPLVPHSMCYTIPCIEISSDNRISDWLLGKHMKSTMVKCVKESKPFNPADHMMNVGADFCILMRQEYSLS